MEAAIAVIAAKGLATTRIADIADRAGMSTGHVMYYFGTRIALSSRLCDTLRLTRVKWQERLSIDAAGLDRCARS